ncbi:hypothetical protein HY29_03220 [Hyphomonas beringensis]|uniref:Uncharacterized protein n=1 Tax=Hyphomonas beringensis TaxID=1280946 RepID=A0A062U749_9PROT|nr:hypothetical protein HY29_03220 [Hyphomonas beringensis]
MSQLILIMSVSSRGQVCRGKMQQLFMGDDRPLHPAAMTRI